MSKFANLQSKESDANTIVERANESSNNRWRIQSKSRETNGNSNSNQNIANN